MSFPPVDEQLAVLTRGAAQFDGSMREELKKKLEKSFTSGKPLRVKYGIDPTGFDVHLGHTVPLRKLRQFQEFGHTAVLIIGTATAAVGDPSGRDASRQGLTTEQIDKNAQTYLTQIAKVVDVSKAEVRPNGEWFSKFTFADMLKLLGHTTMQRMIERDDFTKRIKAGAAIYLHECLYPLMQGHDSVEIRADVELGGTEQLYNLMVGRDLQRAAGQEPQICLTMPILRGTDGEKKMGKSVGNYIGLNEPAKDMFGKTMRIHDELLTEWYALLTDRSHEDVTRLLTTPLEAKKTLAADIVRFYHGEEVASATRADWDNAAKNIDPVNIDDISIPADKIKDGAMLAVDLIAETKLTASKSEARRKIEEGAFNYGPGRTKPADVKATVPVTDGLVIRLGRKILRVRLG
ncbi:Tyrosine--tRNA ligase [Gemmata obscuriglobus]|uniref:Tyrosine--tRNA ligase n=1 Tax=Gemmata obscuriglobus TaxID=114 RepID=A0A2Z3GV81_9BACT|nr:tyrosine--tRNA ligase [Gemmata obscuriglobus]AWM37208.1 tyrosine--tRNA ligase [Gemmata obscuriglobus]QEG30052.1 Tyrosine--tRNA ligase [Gemmata obscuriglobus]VTS09373.1 tyrosyl-trna synthetase : Tyrosine--tRNA ligase OS=Isosphaera pallida (strain ATCC 43644 / DSM 9630 / IS1B) GN=tyrS PE=3 SV=1: tRNA-synt_1b [Gemmata obscuriglobus UQM 2246]